MRGFDCFYDLYFPLKESAILETCKWIRGPRPSPDKGAALIVTTEKDAVRLPRLEVDTIPIVFLRVNVRIVRGAADFSDCLARLCYV